MLKRSTAPPPAAVADEGSSPKMVIACSCALHQDGAPGLDARTAPRLHRRRGVRRGHRAAQGAPGRAVPSPGMSCARVEAAPPPPGHVVRERQGHATTAGARRARGSRARRHRHSGSCASIEGAPPLQERVVREGSLLAEGKGRGSADVIYASLSGEFRYVVSKTTMSYEII
jgi:hypothetical protein